MDKKLARLLGAAATLSTMTAAQAGPRAGAPRGYQLSQPSRPDPERPAAAESRRSTDGAKRRYPDRPGRGRTSSPSSPSSLKRKGVRLDALFYMHLASERCDRRREAIPASPERGAYSMIRRGCRANLETAIFAKPDFSPTILSRPKPLPNLNRTTMNPDEMFHKSRSRRRSRSTWPGRF